MMMFQIKLFLRDLSLGQVFEVLVDGDSKAVGWELSAGLRSAVFELFLMMIRFIPIVGQRQSNDSSLLLMI